MSYTFSPILAVLSISVPPWWGLFFRSRAISAITTILGFSISAIFGSHGNSANLVPLPLLYASQIGVAFTHIIPGSSQIGVHFSILTSIGVHFRG